MGKEHINKELMEKYPNRYKLTTQSIEHLLILDWDRLKENTEQDPLEKAGQQYKHEEGCNIDGEYNDECYFHIHFKKRNNSISCWFSKPGDCCREDYNFNTFYCPETIHNELEMHVQVNAIRWLNKMIDEGVLALNVAPYRIVDKHLV